jgi:hypothetical protein
MSLESRSTSAGAFVLPDPEQVAAADPSKSVRSDAIPKCLAGQFADLETYPRFGSLLFVLWWSLNHEALFDRPTGHPSCVIFVTWRRT